MASAASAYRLTSNQSINSGVLTLVELNGELYDLDNEFDNVSGFDFTAKTAGKFHISAQVTFNGDGAAGDYLIVRVQVNSVNVMVKAIESGGTEQHVVGVSKVIELDVDDVVTLHAENSDNNDTIVASHTLTFMTITGLIL